VLNSGAKRLDPSGDDIVLTGMGAFSALGNDPHQQYLSLLSGKSGIRVLEPMGGVDGYHWLGACIENFDPKLHVQPRKAIKVMCREIQLAFGSAMQACRQANLAIGNVEPERIGTVFTGEIILSDLHDAEEITRLCASNGVMDHARWSVQAMGNMYPLWMLKSLPNMAACHVGIALDARGPNNTLTTEGTSGLGAMLEAINVIRRNKADVMIVGSTASRINPLRLIQRHTEDFTIAVGRAESACRPFAVDRDGTVPAESSSAIVLERRSHAMARGAKVFGRVLSWANTFGPCTTGRWHGVETSTHNALAQLLSRSGLAASNIDHINAGAGGTVAGDSAEARGIHSILADVPVVAYKGALGDSNSASGLIEWISSMEGMIAGTIASTHNHHQTAPDCPIQVLAEPKPREQDAFVKLSHTPDGHCVGVLFAAEESA
jgi:3-oxoacyl-[acyl-carrier-protein] synthase II